MVGETSMAEHATKDDIERLVNLIRESFARIDDRFDAFHARFAISGYSSDPNTYWKLIVELVGTKSNSSTEASFVELPVPTIVFRSASPGWPLSTDIPFSQFWPATFRADPELSTIPFVKPRTFELLVNVPRGAKTPVYFTLLIRHSRPHQALC